MCVYIYNIIYIYIYIIMLYNINVKFSAINIKPFINHCMKENKVINNWIPFHAKIGLVLKNTRNCSQNKIQKC